jgi:meiotically up-regulated gene 157 (Mug157) protein
MKAIFKTIRDQSKSSWSDDWEFVSYYNWTGTAGSLSPPVPNGGNGEPKLANGLVASSHRPSDDLCVFSKFFPLLPLYSYAVRNAEMLGC